MSVTLRSDGTLSMIEKEEGEFLNGDAFLFGNVDFGFGNGYFGIGDFCEEFGVSGFGFRGVVGAEVDGSTAVVNDGVVFFLIFILQHLGS